jgi:hypothetical protein
MDAGATFELFEIVGRRLDALERRVAWAVGAVLGLSLCVLALCVVGLCGGVPSPFGAPVSLEADALALPTESAVAQACVKDTLLFVEAAEYDAQNLRGGKR